MTRERLAQELCSVIDAATEGMPCRDAFEISSSAIIINVVVIGRIQGAGGPGDIRGGQERTVHEDVDV